MRVCDLHEYEGGGGIQIRYPGCTCTCANVCVKGVCVVCERVCKSEVQKDSNKEELPSLSTDLRVVSCPHSGMGAVPSVSGRALSLLPW